MSVSIHPRSIVREKNRVYTRNNMHAGLQGSMHMHIGIIGSELANIARDQAREIKPKKKLEEQQKYSAGVVKTKTQPLLLYI